MTNFGGAVITATNGYILSSHPTGIFLIPLILAIVAFVIFLIWIDKR